MVIMMNGSEVRFPRDLLIIHKVPLGSDDSYQLLIKVTHEGIILDLMDFDGTEIRGTAGYTIDELAELCH